MIDDEIRSIVENNVCALATVDSKGKPHAIAVAYVKVLDRDKLLVTDNFMVETIANLKSNPHVALVVWNRDWEENCIGYEIKGLAEYHVGDSYHKLVKEMPENDGLPAKGALLIKVEKVNRLKG